MLILNAIREHQSGETTVRVPWRSLEDAPLDGAEVELLIRNGAYFDEFKLHGKECAERLWQGIVRAKWIDHNRGRWTWTGIAGSPLGWRPLFRPTREMAGLANEGGCVLRELRDQKEQQLRLAGLEQHPGARHAHGLGG